MLDRPDRLCSPCDHDGHTCAAFGCAQEVDGMNAIAHSDDDNVGDWTLEQWRENATYWRGLAIDYQKRLVGADARERRLEGAVEDGVALRQKMRDAAKALRDGAPAADVVRLLDHHAARGQS